MRRFVASLPFVCALGALSPAFGQILTVQNTNNTLDVVNPNGPSSIVNLRIPLSLLGSSNDPILGGVNNSATAGATGVFGLIRQFSPGANSAAVRGVNNGTGPAGIGVWGEQHGSGFGVYGQSQAGIGVHGVGQDASATGIDGRHLSTSGTAPGVFGLSHSQQESAHAVLGEMAAGASPTSAGVRGLNPSGFGVFGRGGSIGVVGSVDERRTRRIRGRIPELRGVYGSARGRAAHGVVGEAHSEAGEVFGVWGISHSSSGVGVKGLSVSETGIGVLGMGQKPPHSYGVVGVGAQAGVWGRSFDHWPEFTNTFGALGTRVAKAPHIPVAVYGQQLGGGHAGLFDRHVTVVGILDAGIKQFRIDHPLDPENRYLVHASVESAERINVYSGNVTTDENAQATVLLPSYFEALNRDFRYQLTVIGQFAQAIVAEKVRGNRFVIRTDKPGVEVSWQVTGVRQDPLARLYPLEVEPDKPGEARGRYLVPEALGRPATDGVYYQAPADLEPKEEPEEYEPGQYEPEQQGLGQQEPRPE
jgi:hypothetical protein